MQGNIVRVVLREEVHVNCAMRSVTIIVLGLAMSVTSNVVAMAIVIIAIVFMIQGVIPAIMSIDYL